jgi:hypothetical protein
VNVTVVPNDIPTPLQAFALVVVTVAVVVEVNSIDAVVAPFDHKYESALDELNVTVSPLHAVVDVALIVGTGELETLTLVEVELAEQPFKSVTVTENVPELSTVIAAVVAAFDHTLPIGDEEVRITDPPVQNVVEPLVLTVGVAGKAFTVTVTNERGLSSPAAFF